VNHERDDRGNCSCGWEPHAPSLSVAINMFSKHLKLVQERECPFHGPDCVADPREGQDFDWQEA
jgi:hypothetical protein